MRVEASEPFASPKWDSPIAALSRYDPGMTSDVRARRPLGLTNHAEAMAVPSPADMREAALDALARGDGEAVIDAALLQGMGGCPPYHRRAPARVPGPAGLYGWRNERWHVVIPVRGAHESLARCIESLGGLEDSDSFDVTLVCPIDERGAVQLIVDESAFPTMTHGGSRRISVIPTTEPCSFARNCNEGVEDYWPDSDVVVFLNSDADVTPLVSLRGAFAVALGHADAVGPSGTNVSGFQNATEGLSPREALSRCVVAVKPPIPRLVGFCLAVRLGAFRDVGGWDEALGNNFTDDDLSLRLALRSTPGRPSLLWVPSVLVQHEGQASFRELPDAEAVYAADMAENEKRFRARWGWTLPAVAEWWRTI